MARRRERFLELLNRDGYLAQRVAADKPIGRATAQPFVNGSPGLVWELFNCMKWLWRGETEFTRGYLQRLGAAIGQQGAERPQ